MLKCGTQKTSHKRPNEPGLHILPKSVTQGSRFVSRKRTYLGIN